MVNRRIISRGSDVVSFDGRPNSKPKGPKWKRYYVPGVDPELHQLEETPASRARTEKQRFVITIVLSGVAAAAAVAGAVFAALAYLQ